MLRNRVLGERHSIVGGIGTSWLFLATQQPRWALLLCDVSISYHRQFSVQCIC